MTESTAEKDIVMIQPKGGNAIEDDALKRRIWLKLR